jgi:hypothetical protein
MSSPPMLEESRIQTCHDDADVDLPITLTQRTTSPEPDFYARFFGTMDRPSIRMLLDVVLLVLVVMCLLCASSPKHSTGLDSSNVSSATTTQTVIVT